MTKITLNETYSSGTNWLDTFRDNLLFIPEKYRDLVVSEANIRRNLCGGSWSGYYWSELNRVVELLNEGNEPSFPNVDWNDEFIKKTKKSC